MLIKYFFIIYCLISFSNGKEIKVLNENLDKINEIRTNLKIDNLKFDFNLSKIALQHSKYQVENNIISHLQENNLSKNFIGKNLKDRFLYLNKNKISEKYKVNEIITISENPLNNIDNFINSVYHRFKIINPIYQYCGIGIEKDNMTNNYLTTINFLSKNYDSNKTIFISYPYDNQENIPIAFNSDLEIPDPIKEYSIVGYPLTIIMDKSFEIYKIDLIEKKFNEDVKGKFLTFKEDNELNENEYVFIPLKKLKFDSTYNYKIYFKNIFNGKKFIKNIIFKTEKENLLILKNNIDNILRIEKNSINHFFFERKQSNFIKNISIIGNFDKQTLPNIYFTNERLTIEVPNILGVGRLYIEDINENKYEYKIFINN